MIFTPLLQKAIQFATKVHKDQYRKGKDTQYISHPLTVALILSRVTDNENVVCAGILHDTIEDSKPYGSVTQRLLTEAFNADIARMVNDVTEQDKNLPWLERKMAALEHIKDMQKDSLLVKSADVLHNLSELVSDVEQNGIEVFDKFNASKSDTLIRYKKLIPTIENVWRENPLNEDLKYALDKLLKLTDENKTQKSN